jgi:hypothetical protein
MHDAGCVTLCVAQVKRGCGKKDRSLSRHVKCEHDQRASRCKICKKTTVVETVCVCMGANRGGARCAGTNAESFITETGGEIRINNKQKIMST